VSNNQYKILVTGVAGFLGSHLSEHLTALGHKVIGIDNMIGGYKDNIPKDIEFHNIDCCEFEKIKEIMSGVEVVYHCAATAHEGLSVFSPYEITKNNYLASVSIFSAAVNEKVKRIIFCSSMARYGSQKHPFTEKILIIDDLIATGGTAEAAAKLIELSGGSVAGFIFIINLFDLPGNELLKKKSYFTESLMEFPGH